MLLPYRSTRSRWTDWLDRSVKCWRCRISYNDTNRRRLFMARLFISKRVCDLCKH